jgi:uncharacterized caspase-like protein
VILDACHSGQTGAQEVATNDQAVDVLAGKGRTPLLVIAASKGRQESEESAKLGGVFTQSVAEAITTGRAASDLNRNGVIEVSEVYGAVKARVQQLTKGRQTPWLVRSGLYGDFPLF